MIPIIYDEHYTGYRTPEFKLYLRDTISCEVTEERNGAYTLDLTYPLGGINWEEIKPERIIEARVNDEGDIQPFRIRTVTKDAEGTITVEAQHLSYDLTSYPGWILELSNMTAEQVMTRVFVGTGFSASSDITGRKDFVTKNPTTARALLFGIEGSVLDTFGGELSYDRQTVYLNRSRGEDNGVIIDYAKNITMLTEEESTETVYAGVFPYAVFTNDSGEEETVATNPIYYQDCDIDRRSVLVKDFSDQFDSDEVPTTTRLEQIASDWMAVNPINLIAPKVEVSFAPLWYGSYEASGSLPVHERVHLCDTVTVQYAPLEIEQKAKVVRTKYDVLDEKFNEIAVGMWRTSFAETYAAMSDQTEATLTAVSRYPSRWKKDIEIATEDKVLKSGDTMTGALINGSSANSRRAVMYGHRFYVENTTDTAQNSSLFYNGISTTDGTHTMQVIPTKVAYSGGTTDMSLIDGRLEFDGGGYNAKFGRSSSVITKGNSSGTFGWSSATLTNGTNTAALSATGLDLDGTVLTSGIGSTIRDSGGVSTQSGVWTALGSIPLTKGTWLITVFVVYMANSNGLRSITLNTTSGASSGQTAEYADTSDAVSSGNGLTRLRIVVPRVVGSNTTMYINGLQTSGGPLSATWVYNCVRIL